MLKYRAYSKFSIRLLLMASLAIQAIALSETAWGLGEWPLGIVLAVEGEVAVAEKHQPLAPLDSIYSGMHLMLSSGSEVTFAFYPLSVIKTYTGSNQIVIHAAHIASDQDTSHREDLPDHLYSGHARMRQQMAGVVMRSHAEDSPLLGASNFGALSDDDRQVLEKYQPDDCSTSSHYVIYYLLMLDYGLYDEAEAFKKTYYFHLSDTPE